MNCKHLIAAATVAFAGVGIAHADVNREDWAGPEALAAQTASPTAEPLSRVEVQADWNLWQKSGMGQYQVSERSYDADPKYQQRLADYQRMRSGPAYVEEIRRLGGDVSAVAYMYEHGYVPTTY